MSTHPPKKFIHEARSESCPRGLTVMGALGATVACITLGAIACKLFKQMKSNREHDRLDQELDRDLEQSMYGSEPTAKY